MILTVDQAFKSRKTFYVKFWQGNGYYPVDKFEWNEARQEWERFDEKVDSNGVRFWYSSGFPRGGDTVPNEEFIRYTLEHMAVVISDIDMTNNRVFSRTLEIQ